MTATASRRAAPKKPPTRTAGALWWVLEPGCKVVQVATDPANPPAGAACYCREGDTQWTRVPTPQARETNR